MTTKELQELLDSYQTGTATREETVSDTGIGELEIDNYPEEEEPVKPMTLYQRARAAAGGKSAVAEDYTGEAVSAGYGTSKYDTSYSPGMDLEQNRALEQSWFSQVGTGLTKGGITALATAANTTAGVLAGAGSALFDLAFDLNGDGRGFMKSLDAGVNNWVSERLVELQNWSEEALPNYRTQEERSEEYQKEWYKHMHTGNFIGDSILKNFGFTIGALGGGAAWTRFIGKRMTKKLAGDVLKVVGTLKDKPDLIVLDPPRDGVHPKALDQIIDFGVDHMVYISCKPTSLVRDLVVLQERGYKVERAAAIDMFPSTGNCETAVSLSRVK